MVITASKLRQDIYRLLDQVLETGEPLEIERKGRRLRLVPDERPSRVAALDPHPGTILGDPEELIHHDWSGEWRPDPVP
ncbi:type II toxin-antitoxin system Phd/YefM family antitoxin [Euzebya sp.]|uniref:type II toxin-antitoxin system Phd/YefM family antitoxin n=1 Tax=Euzebya sp. TaxID=1971409 RepID=UPI003518B756